MPVGAVSNRASVFRSPVGAVSNRASARCALTKRAYGRNRVRPNARVFRLPLAGRRGFKPRTRKMRAYKARLRPRRHRGCATGRRSLQGFSPVGAVSNRAGRAISVGAVSNRARRRCALTKRAYGLADIGDALPVGAVSNRARRRCALTKRAYGRSRVRPNEEVHPS